MLKRIVIGLDGSDYSDSAMRTGCILAQKTGATIVGLAVIDLPGIEKHLRGAPPGAYHMAEVEREHKLADAGKKTERFLQQCQRHCRETGVKCHLAAPTGDPLDVIAAESRTADLVIVGLRTFFHFETSTKSGETLRKLLEQSISPVLAVPEKATEPEKVLLTYDGSIPAAKAIRIYLQLSQGLDLHHLILNVCDDREKSDQLLDALSNYMRSHGIEAESLSLPGHPGQVILEVAKKIQPAVVVMGAYGESVLKKMLFGTTANSLIEDGTIPLFTYH